MKYEIIDHGVDNIQYFQGCGTAFSEFDNVVTGVGFDASEAYQNAVDMVAQILNDDEFDLLDLPKRPRGIRKKNRVKMRYYPECQYYVSIRF